MHRRPSARRSSQIPTTGYSRACNRPSRQHATASTRCRRSQAPTHSASLARARSVLPRSSDVSCVILKRLGASNAAPAAPIRLPARPTAPRLAPRNPQPSATAPRATAPAHNKHHQPCTTGGSQAAAHIPAAADARSVRLRTSDVSCAISARLGASDAAPSSTRVLPARTAAPRLAPRKIPPTATASRTTAPAYSTQQHQRTAGVRKHPLTAPLPPMHAAYQSGLAKSAASSLRDSVPATLPQLR